MVLVGATDAAPLAPTRLPRSGIGPLWGIQVISMYSKVFGFKLDSPEYPEQQRGSHR
ncbi:hypothetical protein F751_1935 [Auxenochlorella protothecoides]|uniref:Uncharacterized protein n=1 Tax=Auxenochlorella protothecoides TaxID=3075 RepID=A0A087SH52_AUXPR|nr:hypothetical protein F751_1935 [Auxenochlorella protothecoides]KFM25056.1 hypothetical protein F751_1935 [Auxenochlorella protothecoides]